MVWKRLMVCEVMLGVKPCALHFARKFVCLMSVVSVIEVGGSWRKTIVAWCLLMVVKRLSSA